MYWFFAKCLVLAFFPFPVSPRVTRPDPQVTAWLVSCQGFRSWYRVFRDSQIKSM